MYQPLADRIRPQSLDEMVGQQHLLGPNGLLRRIAQSGTLPPVSPNERSAVNFLAVGAAHNVIHTDTVKIGQLHQCFGGRHPLAVFVFGNERLLDAGLHLHGDLG